MTSLTPENLTGRQPGHTRLDRQYDSEPLEKKFAECVYDQDAPLSDAHGPRSIESEDRRRNVYLFRKSKRASLGAARII